MSDLSQLLQRLREERRRIHQISEETPFDQCVNICEAGRIFRDASSLDEAVSTLSDSDSISSEEARYRIKQYYTMFEKSPRLSHWAEFFGSRFIAGQSVDELAPESRFSNGEIRRWIREYVGVHLEEVDLTAVDLPEEPPETETIFTRQMDALTEATEMVSDVDLSAYLDSVDEIESSDFEFKWVDFLVGGIRDELYRIYQEEGEDAVISALSQLLNDEETIDAIFSQVDSRYLQGERKVLIEQSIEAHNRGEYGLAIPAALTQIDGALIEAATDLGIWELDDEVTGVSVVATSEGSPQHISGIRHPFRDEYPRLMGRGTPRAKILHGIRTDSVHDEGLSTKVIWMALKSFSVAERIFTEMYVPDKNILDFLEVSSPKDVVEVAERFQTNEAHAEHRCEQLVEQGYLEVTTEGEYTVTAAGRLQLSEFRGY